MIAYSTPSDDILLLKAKTREIEDFPRKGIFTQDVMPLFQDRELFRLLIAELAILLEDVDCDVIAGVESRGFMIGPSLAKKLGKRFVPIAKCSAPHEDTVHKKYWYEYSEDELELRKDALQEGEKVVIVDDQVVTGGTILTAADLVEKIGGVVAGCAFILAQTHYDGLKSLEKYEVYALFEKNPSR